ncbi:MAG: hypothetical protein WCW65_00760 [Candidatus Paceibacterota bacterium]
MDFNHIKEYLNKTKEILFMKEEIYRIISIVIEKNISFKVEQKLIKIKRNTIYIKISPLIKNEILIKKEKILKEIFEINNDIKFKEIK